MPTLCQTKELFSSMSGQYPGKSQTQRKSDTQRWRGRWSAWSTCPEPSLGSARAMWQLLPGTPGQHSSQLEWKKSVWLGTKSFTQVWGSTKPHPKSTKGLQLPTAASLGFLTGLKPSARLWVSEAPRWCWIFQQLFKNVSTANFNDAITHHSTTRKANYLKTSMKPQTFKPSEQRLSLNCS